MPIILVRYGEVGLKSERVRRRFETALLDDIRQKHARSGIPCSVTLSRGRIFVDSSDWRRSCELLSRTFGIVSFSPSTMVQSDLDRLIDEVVRFADPLLFDGASFAIRARRSGTHPYTSITICEKAGAAVLAANEGRDIRVDLDEPDIEISVEVRGREAYLFSSTLRGPGGLPKSTAGRVFVRLTSRKGIAAAWLLMKRGCTAIVSADDPVVVDSLRTWDEDLRVVDSSDDDLFGSAASSRCLAVALDWNLKEFDERGAPVGEAPVLYPLVGMTDDEIDGLTSRIMKR